MNEQQKLTLKNCLLFKCRLNSSLFLIALGLSLSNGMCQESINTSGSIATGNGGTVSYSVGQLAFTAISSNSGTVSQGVQQAYEIYTIGIKETEFNIALTAFPNPTIENLTLEIRDNKNENLTFMFIDLQSKLLESGQITSPKTQIKTSHLSLGIYFLDIYNHENKKVQSFKIVKN
jgi:hypothetical protein